VQLTEEQQFRQYVIKVFQNIDRHYYTNIDWFINLNINSLKKYYRILEDIWNWRANLSYEVKKNIIKDNIVFSYINMNTVSTTNNIKIIRNIILKDILVLVSASDEHSYNNLGSIYVLTALASVCNECYECFDWLDINIIN